MSKKNEEEFFFVPLTDAQAVGAAKLAARAALPAAAKITSRLPRNKMGQRPSAAFYVEQPSPKAAMGFWSLLGDVATVDNRKNKLGNLITDAHECSTAGGAARRRLAPFLCFHPPRRAAGKTLAGRYATAKAVEDMLAAAETAAYLSRQSVSMGLPASALILVSAHNGVKSAWRLITIAQARKVLEKTRRGNDLPLPFVTDAEIRKLEKKP